MFYIYQNGHYVVTVYETKILHLLQELLLQSAKMHRSARSNQSEQSVSVLSVNPVYALLNVLIVEKQLTITEKLFIRYAN